jgi:hypothetical protein
MSFNARGKPIHHKDLGTSEWCETRLANGLGAGSGLVMMVWGRVRCRTNGSSVPIYSEGTKQRQFTFHSVAGRTSHTKGCF